MSQSNYTLNVIIQTKPYGSKENQITSIVKRDENSSKLFSGSSGVFFVLRQNVPSFTATSLTEKLPVFCSKSLLARREMLKAWMPCANRASLKRA